MSGMVGGIGTMALSRLLGTVPTLPPKVKRVIFLFQSGGPSQMDLFDHKPSLYDLRDTDLPDSIRQGQRFTGMTATQERFPVVPTLFNFARHGESQAWVSDLLPYTAKIVDELCFIRTMKTEAINHDPAITFFSDRVSVGRTTEYRGLVVLWLGQRE